MANQTPSDQPKDSSIKKPKQLSAEQWALLAAGVSALLFACIVMLLLLPRLAARPRLVPSQIVAVAATRGFVLPPTWTPAPTEMVIPTPPGTPVAEGLVPTRMYTPRPTSWPGLPPLPTPIFQPKLSVLDLARIMQGESPGDPEAAYYVGWVAKNRLLHPSYGDTYAVVSYGFFGYRADMQPNKQFLEIARRVIRAREDPTGGCLYALSRTDITNLGVPPSRADVTKGEWFFFKTWPVGSGRRAR